MGIRSPMDTDYPMDTDTQRHVPGAPTAGMTWIPAGEFTMGSADFYPEERPVHMVAVDGFWIDIRPVTVAEFRRFVKRTGHVTVAELAPDPAAYPGARPELLVPGSLVFQKPPAPVDLRDYANWWAYVPGASWRQPEGPGSDVSKRDKHPVTHVTYADVMRLCQVGGQGPADGGRVGVRGARRPGRRRVRVGR